MTEEIHVPAAAQQWFAAATSREMAGSMRVIGELGAGMSPYRESER